MTTSPSNFVEKIRAAEASGQYMRILVVDTWYPLQSLSDVTETTISFIWICPAESLWEMTVDIAKVSGLNVELVDAELLESNRQKLLNVDKE